MHRLAQVRDELVTLAVIESNERDDRESRLSLRSRAALVEPEQLIDIETSGGNRDPTFEAGVQTFDSTRAMNFAAAGS